MCSGVMIEVSGWAIYTPQGGTSGGASPNVNVCVNNQGHVVTS